MKLNDKQKHTASHALALAARMFREDAANQNLPQRMRDQFKAQEEEAAQLALEIENSADES